MGVFRPTKGEGGVKGGRGVERCQHLGAFLCGGVCSLENRGEQGSKG